MRYARRGFFCFDGKSYVHAKLQRGKVAQEASDPDEESSQIAMKMELKY